jgi:hypothetical protein
VSEWGVEELVEASVVSSPENERPWPSWAQRFLEVFVEVGTVYGATRIVGIDQSTPYKLRERDARFAAAWADAEEQSTQALENEARRRALVGTEEPVYQGGQLVGVIRKFSDTLTIFLLKARRPEVYRENHRVELTGDQGGPIRTQVVPPELNDHERLLLRRAIDGALAQEEGEPVTAETPT